MKYVKKYLFMSFALTLIPCVLSMEETKDPELAKILETMMEKLKYLPNRNFPDLPTKDDVKRFESALFTSNYKLPMPLKEYHLTCGNRIFEGGIRFPTIHQKENDGRYSCNLLNFIREGHDKGVPFKATETSQEYWIPFAEDGSDYICMELRTEKVCNFYIDSRLRKDDTEFSSLSAWLKDRLLLK